MRLQLEILTMIFVLLSGKLFAQPDSMKPKVTIISAYRPTVVSPEKIQFTATPFQADTQLHLKPYNVPLQNIVYSYQSAQLHPLAIQSEDETPLDKSHYYLKAGYGNYQTPLVSARASVAGIPSTLLNGSFNYLSSKGNIEHQDFKNMDGAVSASHFFSASELHASGIFKNQDFYLYGYDHGLQKKEAKDIVHAFQRMDASIGYKNTAQNSWGINYHPVVGYRSFVLRDSLEEKTIQANLPLDISIRESWKIELNMSAEQTSILQKRFVLADTTVQNNLYQIKPFVSYRHPLFTAGIGAVIAQDRGKWRYLPEVSFVMPMKDTALLLSAGLHSVVKQNTYQTLSQENPFLLSFIQPYNQRSTEYYLAASAFLGKYVQLSTKLSYGRIRQFAFYVNDTTSTLKAHLYSVSMEDKINNLRAQMDMSYTFQDKINVSAGVELNGYSGMKLNERAWNILPMQIHASAMYKYKKDWTFKGNWWLFSGSYYPVNGGKESRIEGGNDLSVEAIYSIRKNISAFASINNIFGKSYQRWYAYPVYGINGVGGLQFRF